MMADLVKPTLGLGTVTYMRKRSMPSGPHMLGRYFMMTPMTDVWEDRQSFGFLLCGILGPPPPPIAVPTPCTRELFPSSAHSICICCYVASSPKYHCHRCKSWSTAQIKIAVKILRPSITAKQIQSKHCGSCHRECDEDASNWRPTMIRDCNSAKNPV